MYTSNRETEVALLKKLWRMRCNGCYHEDCYCKECSELPYVPWQYE